jgi:hypothetical protein
MLWLLNTWTGKWSCELHNLTTGLQYAKAERVLCCESHVWALKKIYRKKPRDFLLSSSLGPSSPLSSQLVQMCTPSNTERRQSYRELASESYWSSESIEWFIDDQAFLRSYDSAPPAPPLPSASCLSFSVFLCVAGRATDGRGWARSQIIRQREGLAPL